MSRVLRVVVWVNNNRFIPSIHGQIRKLTDQPIFFNRPRRNLHHHQPTFHLPRDSSPSAITESRAIATRRSSPPKLCTPPSTSVVSPPSSHNCCFSYQDSPREMDIRERMHNVGVVWLNYRVTLKVVSLSNRSRLYFCFTGITRAFFGSDFVTVTNSEDPKWDLLKPEIFDAIMDLYSFGQPLILDTAAAASMDTTIKEDDSETVAMIKELLETRIRPAVQDDGGDIEYVSFDLDTGIVKLRMQGACSGCPSSSFTLKSGIENMLMHYVHEVKGVKQELDDEDEGVVLTGSPHDFFGLFFSAN
ncbi:hypothetical protein ACS0TY_010157 [Phlomoides rotata]